MAWNDPAETSGYKTNFDPAFIEKILSELRIAYRDSKTFPRPKTSLGRIVRDDSGSLPHPG